MNEAINHLTADGWKEYPNQFKKNARCFYKRFDTPTQCHCNDKPGIQIEIAVYDHGARGVSFEMELAGELSDGTWFRAFQWSLPSDIQQAVSVIPRMLAAWEAANNFKE